MDFLWVHLCVFFTFFLFAACETSRRELNPLTVQTTNRLTSQCSSQWDNVVTDWSYVWPDALTVVISTGEDFVTVMKTLQACWTRTTNVEFTVCLYNRLVDLFGVPVKNLVFIGDVVNDLFQVVSSIMGTVLVCGFGYNLN